MSSGGRGGGGQGWAGGISGRGQWTGELPIILNEHLVVPLAPDELLPCLQPRMAWLLPTELPLPSSCSHPTLSLSPPPMVRYRKFLQLHKEQSGVMLVPMMVRG